MALPCSLGAQASGELERGSEEVARLVYSMLQDANSIGHAQTAEPGTFQRLSSTPALAPDRSFTTHLLTPVRRLLAVTFSGFEYMGVVGADCIYVIKRNIYVVLGGTGHLSAICCLRSSRCCVLCSGGVASTLAVMAMIVLCCVLCTACCVLCAVLLCALRCGLCACALVRCVLCAVRGAL